MIFSHYSHTRTLESTSMTLQVINKGFKGTASNGFVSVMDRVKTKGEGHSRLLLWARIFLELTHLNSPEKLQAQVHLDGWNSQPECVITYIKCHNWFAHVIWWVGVQDLNRKIPGMGVKSHLFHSFQILKPNTYNQVFSIIHSFVREKEKWMSVHN